MATYRAIRGLEIQVQSSDPSDPPKGQVWYNTTSGTIKVAGAGAWSSGGNITTGRGGMGGAQQGLQTAALIFGGGPPGVVTEEYDGTAWTAVNGMLTPADGMASGGTQTSALSGFGYTHPADINTTEEYNGTSWSNVNNGNTARRDAGCCGTQTSCMAMGGYTPSPAVRNDVESYDGTSWTIENNLINDRWDSGGIGNTTSCIVGGGDPGNLTSTEEYDGTCFSAVNAMGTGQAKMANIGTAIGAALFAGNYDPISAPGTTLVQSYDGTSWSAASPLTNGTDDPAWGQGTTGAGLVAGGNQAGVGVRNETEEFTEPGITTITTST